MKLSQPQFEQLLRTAKTASPEEAPQPPWGFAARVAARWAHSQPAIDGLPARVLERLCARAALATSAAALVVALLAWGSTSTPEGGDEAELAAQLEELTLYP